MKNQKIGFSTSYETYYKLDIKVTSSPEQLVHYYIYCNPSSNIRRLKRRLGGAHIRIRTHTFDNSGKM